MGISNILEGGVVPVNRNVASVTVGSIAMVLKYIGAQVYACITVAAGGDMTFEHGASSGTKVVDADPLLGLNSSGASTTDGIIDLSTPNAVVDTYAELINHINGSANWRCVGVDAGGSFLTNNTLITRAATEVTNTNNGLPLYLDPAVALIGTSQAATIAVTRAFLYNNYRKLSPLSDSQAAIPEGFKRVNRLYSAVLNITDAATPLLFNVYEVDDVNVTTNLVWSATAQASTVDNTTPAAWGDNPITSKPGSRLILAILGTAGTAITAVNLSLIGDSYVNGINGIPSDRAGRVDNTNW